MLLTSPLSLSIILSILTLSGSIIFFVSLISKYKEQIKNCNEQVDDLHGTCEKLKQQLSSTDKANILLCRDIDIIKQQHQKHLDRLKPEYRKIYTQLMSTIDKLEIMTTQFHESEDAFDSLLDDNRELEHEIHGLSVENLHLRDEIALLKSRAYDFKPKQSHTTALQAKSISPKQSSTIHDSLSKILSTITLNANVMASAIADNLGFIVAEKGQRKYTEGLAGIAASFDSLNNQIHSFIPFGELRQITVTDKNDVTISAFPFMVSDEKLVVMLLSSGTAPTTSAVEQALTAATDLYSDSTTSTTQNINQLIIAQ